MFTIGTYHLPEFEALLVHRECTESTGTRQLHHVTLRQRSVCKNKKIFYRITGKDFPKKTWKCTWLPIAVNCKLENLLKLLPFTSAKPIPHSPFTVAKNE